MAVEFTIELFGIDGCFRWSINGFCLWRAGGGPRVPYIYGFGFWCGKDNDLLCIRNFGSMETDELEQHLSPLRRNVFVAFLHYHRARQLLKRGMQHGSRIHDTSHRG